MMAMMIVMTNSFSLIIYLTFLEIRGGRHAALCVLGLYN